MMTSNIMRWGLVVVILVGFSVAANAEPILTWTAALKEAKSGHPDLAAARAAIRSAEAAVKSSRAAYLPDVTGSAGHSRAHSSSGGDDFDYGFTASQRIYPGVTDRPEVVQAKANLLAVRSDLRAVSAAVRFDLKSAYASLLHAQELVRLSEKIAERRARNVELVKARFDAGREHKGSFLRAQAQAQEAKFDLRQARRALRVAQREFLRALGRPAFTTVRVAEILQPDTPPELAVLEDLAERVPAVERSYAEVSAAKAGVTIKRQDFYPTLTASGTADRSGGSWPPSQKSGQWTGKVALSVPIFKGGSEKADVDAAKANYEQSAAGAKSVLHQTLSDLEGFLAAFADAVENISVQSMFQDAAQTRAEIAQAQYTSGLLSFENWDIIENDLIGQQKRSLASIRDGVLAQARWEQAVGKGLDE